LETITLRFNGIDISVRRAVKVVNTALNAGWSVLEHTEEFICRKKTKS